jgi:uncharacterized protein
MFLEDKIQKDLIEAMKHKEELKTSVLRLLTAAVLNKAKEKRYKLKEEKDVSLTEEELIGVIVTELKKRKEAVLEYQKGQRQDLADKEKKEAEILQKYLPEQLSEQEIRGLVKKAIAKTGAKEAKDMGRVMSALIPQIKGRADGGAVSAIVKELLS